MEYLMTYGWAILIIAIVLVAFFSLNLFNPYTFSPKASPGSCQILRPNGPDSNLFVSAVGPTCTTNEIPQYVAQFQGVGGENLTVPATLTPSSGFTVVLWFKRTWSTNDGHVHGLFSVGGGCGFPGASQGSCDTNTVEIFKYADNNWYFRAENSTGSCGIIIPDSAISGNIWHQITFEDTVGSGLSLWIDDGTPYTCSQSSPAIAWQTQNLYIGEGYAETTLIGSMANVQIYNTSLSPSGVNTLYAEGIGGTPVDIQNLVGWWPLNGNGNDYSGNGKQRRSYQCNLHIQLGEWLQQPVNVSMVCCVG
jgi:hypothetical protein